MKTSRLNYTFNAEEVVDKLRPYVTEVQETKGSGVFSEHTYTGFYKGKPVFQVTNKIHILRWGVLPNFSIQILSLLIKLSILLMKLYYSLNPL